MTAFSPFIPHNDRDSSMPVALFSFAIENDTDAPIDYTVAATLGNYGCDSGIHHFGRKDGLSTLHLTSADTERPPEQRGDLAITTDGEDVEHVDYHFRGQWFDSLSLYWREFATSGRLRERRYDKPRPQKNMFQQPEHGTLATRIRVAPRETRHVRFAISWNYPLGSIYWFGRGQPGDAEYAGRPPTWKNYYATQWADAAASGRDAFKRWDDTPGGDLRLPRLGLRLLLSARDHRRGHRHARYPALGDGHPPRGRRGLGVGGAAHPRGLLRGKLHPCVELPAGALQPLPRIGADAPGDRVHL